MTGLVERLLTDPSSLLQRMHTREFDARNRLYKDINAAGTAMAEPITY